MAIRPINPSTRVENLIERLRKISSYEREEIKFKDMIVLVACNECDDVYGEPSDSCSECGGKGFKVSAAGKFLLQFIDTMVEARMEDILRSQQVPGIGEFDDIGKSM
ncbi:MAG: hypothetical protein KAS32_05475 [Candidatus Peribacteraceae bacterium]|nr:hypothetical protein [Candidatus Peribacteraceae bacterium]